MNTIACCDCGAAVKTRSATRTRCTDCGVTSRHGITVAARAVRAAVANGVLPNLKTTDVACADCGKRADRYDHRDYSKPLAVDPVCRSCNAKRGPGLNAVGRAA